MDDWRSIIARRDPAEGSLARYVSPDAEGEAVGSIAAKLLRSPENERLLRDQHSSVLGPYRVTEFGRVAVDIAHHIAASRDDHIGDYHAVAAGAPDKEPLSGGHGATPR
jgi:hypothetical protein